MGASWRCLAAAALLLVLAAASAPRVQAGTAADPEVTDPAGDQAVDTGTVPVVPGVNDVSFDDVDVTAAYVAEFQGQTRITVQTTAGWGSGSMTLDFAIAKGPTSLPASTANGRSFTVFVNGTTVAGVNGSASSTTDGLRIDLPSSGLGAVGGDVLSNLTITTTRTDPGNLQGVTQDDQTGTDEAGPGRAYTYFRVPKTTGVALQLVQFGNGTSRDLTLSQAAAVPLKVRVTNTGNEADAVTLRTTFDPPPPSGPCCDVVAEPSPVALAAGQAHLFNRTIGGAALAAGTYKVHLAATATSGASSSLDLTLTIAAAPAIPQDRDVKPAGLTFLTSTAESMGLDGPFGSYAEAFLLALILLLVIVALFLLLALGRSTLAGEPSPEAPWPAEASPAAFAAAPAALSGPAGMMQTVHASPAEPGAAQASVEAEPTAEGEVPADFGALMAAAEELSGPSATAASSEPAALPTASAASRVRIEEVRHTPREPEAGQAVKTEVILRNDGPSASLRIALSVDGKPAAERTVQVPSRATKAVELAWTAGPGDNRLRIQAFPA